MTVKPQSLSANVRRLTAPNPSPMTQQGTNSYLVGQNRIALIDPGPMSQPHLEAISAAIGPKAAITHILVTHAHLDHSQMAKHASDVFDAPVYAYGDHSAGKPDDIADLAAIAGGEGVDRDFCPDILLLDRQSIVTDEWDIRAIWTPGHFGNHLSFEFETVLFSGDLVMDWSTSLVSPPDGDMGQFMQSLAMLQGLDHTAYFPGHGDIVQNPQRRLAELITHRLGREAEILDHLTAKGATPSEITKEVYADIPNHLWPMAERNVLAHLIDLTRRNIVQAKPALSTKAKFTRC